MYSDFIPKKKPQLYVLLFALWLSASIYFDVKLLSPVFSPIGAVSKIAVIFFLLCLNFFWLYGFYHLFFTIFACFLPKRQRYKLPLLDKEALPKTAILYPTKDDFQEEALLSCLNQDYQDFDVYILDDSDGVEVKKKIDDFIAGHPGVKLIRRNGRNGFKAGNLNNALRQIQSVYPYFAVCDADTILPKDFLSRLLPYFSLSDNLGFVQANQRANVKQKGFFAQILSFNTDLHWKYYVPVKEHYGFTMFYGHGALISMQAWNEAEGFPEIATEDLAFSSLLREKGYFGIFAPEVICKEDYPDTYSRLRKRNKRWISGTAEYLCKYFPSLWINKRISWIEKIDVLVSAVSLLLAFPFLIYILIAGIILPFSQNLFKLNIPVFLVYPNYAENIFDFIRQIKYRIYWPKDFFVIMFISSFAQLLPVFIDLFKNPFKMIRYMAMFSYICLSTIVISSVDFLKYVFAGKAYFPVTGAQDKEPAAAYDMLILILESLCGVSLLYLAYATSNLWLFTIGIALTASPLVLKYNFENKALNVLLYLPFLFNLLILFMIARSLE